MQLHIFGENKSYKHFYEQRLAYKTKRCTCPTDMADNLTQTDTGLAALLSQMRDNKRLIITMVIHKNKKK